MIKYFFFRFFPFFSHIFSLEYREYPTSNFDFDPGFGANMNQMGSSFISAMWVFMVTIFVIVFITYVISLWKIFSDNNIQGWKALIPIYNIYVLLKMLDMSGWWLILYLIDFGYITSVLINYKLVKKYEKILPFIVGLEILPFIFYPILAFSNKTQKHFKTYRENDDIDDEL
ncbi:hypothetical protein OSSY52_19830 [Tepiditoga spiralis]|uniref:Signal peptidase I n=1 Tax=Tepiditoga spiralis TaxID=2108365 RepID=A0A7G1GBN4_9BACT|nr:DUF5684 domain-containing protein [Tepiditoga spiralis]BBE31842.1 hypothetical protein OSSY52_19830 [Tepiditoga spiralis]